MANENYLDKVKEWYDHPEIFVEEVLEEKLTSNQKQILREMAIHNKLSIKSANSIGKTYLFSMVIPWYFFTRIALFPNKSCIVVFTAPVFSQMQTGILGGVKYNIKKAGEVLSKRFKRKITLFKQDPSEDLNNAKFFHNDRSFIIGLASKSANEIAGKHANNVMVLFDEAQGLKDDIYSGFAGIMSSGKVTEILIGNTTLPNGCAGRFYESFQEGSEYKQISITSFDTPNFILPNIKLEDYIRDENDPDFWRNKLDRYCGTNYPQAKFKNQIGQWEFAVIERLPVDGLANPIGVNSIMQKAGYNTEDYEVKTRVLAEFPDSTGASTYPLSWIQNSKEKWNDPNEHITGKKILGIDFGRGVGKDKSAFAYVNGNKCEWIKSFDLKTLEILDKVDDIYMEERFDHIQIENNGEGIHFARLLRDRGYKVYEIDAGSLPGYGKTRNLELREENEKLKKLYALKRDEEWWTLREKINPTRLDGDNLFLLPPYPELERQMRASTYAFNARQQIVVAKKEELRKRLKKSTDELDSLLVAIATIEEDDDTLTNIKNSNLYTFNLKADKGQGISIDDEV